jgi:hypothetical protein
LNNLFIGIKTKYKYNINLRIEINIKIKNDALIEYQNELSKTVDEEMYLSKYRYTFTDERNFYD